MQKDQQIEQMKERLSRSTQNLERLRQQLADKNQRFRLASEQLKTDRQEAARLDELHQQRLAEKNGEIAELKRRLYESSSGNEADDGSGKDRRDSLSEDRATALYLDMMKRCLTGWIYKDSGELARRDAMPFEELTREEGRDWPANAHTMIGLKRLENIQFCIEDAIRNGIPGDLIETGVWRGGTAIFMRAILKAHGVEDRRVWAADSFEGMPPPDAEKYPHDARFDKFTGELAVSLEQVQDNFDRYGLLDGQVRFLKGLFRDTLPTAPVEELAVVRLDGDWYESTMDGLTNLYPKLSVGGYLIVDDYGAVPACRQAVHDYRESQNITEEIRSVDWTGVYWQRAE